ncbi:UNVERIFIED_CONTAM: hypothetical protein HDU68_006736 [Siphonaria sp. JEL0065]|nr:hypothetical protein HDU68_006736 [Siphonaria sp. JEL0065]
MRDRLHELQQFQTPPTPEPQPPAPTTPSKTTKPKLKRFASLRVKSRPSSSETLVADEFDQDPDKITTSQTQPRPASKKQPRTYTTIQSFATTISASTKASGFARRRQTTTIELRQTIKQDQDQNEESTTTSSSTFNEQEDEISTKTDVLLTRVDEIGAQVHSLTIQITRLKNSIAEFETDPAHGMWNPSFHAHQQSTMDSFAKAIIAEKVDVIRDAIRRVKVETLGLSEGLLLEQGKEVAVGGQYHQFRQLVQFHKRKLAKDVGACSDEFKRVVEGMMKRENGVLQLSLKTVRGNAKDDSTWITSESAKTVFADSICLQTINTSERPSAQEAQMKLDSLIQARHDLDSELDREREWKNLESGMTDLVDLFGEMRHIVEFQRRIALGVCGGIVGLLALRDVWQLAVVLLGGSVTRYQLFLRWRLKTFHVEKLVHSSAQLFEPWALVLVLALFGIVQSARRRGLVRYVVAAGAFLLLLRWVAKDIASIYDNATTFNHHTDSGHTYSYAQHHAEAILPVEFANIVLKRIEQARQIAEASNATDHDWLHAMRGVNYPIAFMMPDYYFVFPWSFVFLFLACLAASSLTHRYSVHWSSKGRLRFVKRYPDPEETEGNDTWDTLVDNPDLDPAALSLADQYSAKMEATRLLNNLQQNPETAAVGISIDMPDIPQSETPLAIFPIKDPNASQIEIGNQLRKRRDLHRRITRNVFLGITFIVLFLDLSQAFTIASIKSRIESGKMQNPNVILIVDLGVVPDDYNPPALDDVKVSPTPVAAAIDPSTNMTAEKGTIDSNVSFKGTKHATPHHFPMRPPPQTRPWVPEYPLPMTTFLALMFLVKLAAPPLFAPRVRLRLYKDKLVAIPLTYPVQYKTINFSDIIAIEVRGEETPSGTLYLRHRKYVKIDGAINRTRPFQSVRGYLYSGLGDLGRTSAEDHYLVMLRTREGVEEWGVQVQGMSVDRLRDMLDGAIAAHHASLRAVAGLV